MADEEAGYYSAFAEIRASSNTFPLLSSTRTVENRGLSPITPDYEAAIEISSNQMQSCPLGQ
jgi:hypothetical protein